MISAALSGFIATFGFGILFNIKGYKLILAAVGGMIGSLVYTLCMELAYSEVLSLFIASMCFAIYSEILARVCRTPVTTFIICSLIPLVPGKGMYETMKLAVNGEDLSALSKGIDTLANAGALALGIILVSTLMHLFFHVWHQRKRTG